MSKEDVINYVMTTPSNPNRAVLEGMLEEASEGGGSDLMVVGVVMPDPYTRKIDKDYEEVKDAVLANKPVLFKGTYNSVWFAIYYDGRIEKLRTHSVQIDTVEGKFYQITNCVIDTDGTITVES